MALFRTVKSKGTYREWLISVAKSALLPAINNQAVQIEIMNDQYLKKSIKSCTRIVRGGGEVSQRVHLKSVDRKMLGGKEWEEFFNNGENKEDLISLVCTYYKSEEGRKLFKIPLVINQGEQAWKISEKQIEDLHLCNHEEADTRIVYHAASSNTPAVIIAKDTDVFLLLAYAVCYQDIPPPCYMKIEANQYINMTMIHDSLGVEVCKVLPQLHALTGCDTTAYKFNVGKARILKKVLKDTSSLSSISGLGKYPELSTETMENVKLFVQTIMYSGKINETC